MPSDEPNLKRIKLPSLHQNKYECEYCNFLFTSYRNHLNHIRLHEGQEQQAPAEVPNTNDDTDMMQGIQQSNNPSSSSHPSSSNNPYLDSTPNFQT